MSTPKTVYILGAGFSISGGGPRQDEIMSGIWNLTNEGGGTGAHKDVNGSELTKVTFSRRSKAV